MLQVSKDMIISIFTYEIFPTAKHFEFDIYAHRSKTTTNSRKLIEQFVDKGYKKDVIQQI